MGGCRRWRWWQRRSWARGLVRSRCSYSGRGGPCPVWWSNRWGSSQRTCDNWEHEQDDQGKENLCKKEKTHSELSAAGSPMPSPRSQQRATKYLSHSRSLGSSGSKSSSSSCKSIMPSALPGYSMLASSHSSPSSWSKNSSSFALIIVEFICGGGEKLALAEKAI